MTGRAAGERPPGIPRTDVVHLVPMATPRYRVHVVPATRRIGRLFLPGWLAITIGHDIWTWRPLAGPELAHELCHVRQWDRYGSCFIPRYLRASWQRVAGRGRPVP